MSESDGRRERRRLNKKKILDAVLELTQESLSFPSPEAIAERASVSRRSIFRLFESMDALLSKALDYHLQEIRERHDVLPAPKGDLQERIALLAHIRAELYEFMTPTRVIVERIRHQFEPIEARLVRARTNIRAHLEVYFAQDLPADPQARLQTLDALEAVTSWRFWHTLRSDQSCAQRRRARGRPHDRLAAGNRDASVSPPLTAWPGSERLSVTADRAPCCLSRCVGWHPNFAGLPLRLRHTVRSQ